MSTPTNAHLSALKWLINRSGNGVFEKNRQVLLANGERSPVRRSTWNALANFGLVEFYMSGKRLQVTNAGRATKVDMVEESRGEDA